MITKITKAYTRTYGDTGETTSYIEWIDDKGKSGRTEGERDNLHMDALFRRAKREGVEQTYERWE